MLISLCLLRKLFLYVCIDVVRSVFMSLVISPVRYFALSLFRYSSVFLPLVGVVCFLTSLC